MSGWSPLSLENLDLKILGFELDASEEVINLWDLIKIEPEKWQEPIYGPEGGGFWVVGIYGRQIIWYNDIEEGFNVSEYQTYGQFTEYLCGQSELGPVMETLLDWLKRTRP